MQPEAEPLRDIMDRLGVDMKWYDKVAGITSRNKAIPLSDDHCSRLSIYLYKRDGSLWTTDHGEPYAKVRQGKPGAKDTFVCVHCKARFDTYSAAMEHF